MADTEYEKKLRARIGAAKAKEYSNKYQTLLDGLTNPNHRKSFIDTSEGPKTVAPAMLKKRATLLNVYRKKLNDPQLKEYYKRKEKRDKIKAEEESA